MKNISEHISYKEATHTSTGLKNEPTDSEINTMILTALKVFEPVRKWYGKPIKINSFFRSKEVNKAVKGSATSQHTKGEAIDLTAGSVAENNKLFNWMRDNLEFDQLIYENGGQWIHVSYKYSGKNRKQVLHLKQK